MNLDFYLTRRGLQTLNLGRMRMLDTYNKYLYLVYLEKPIKSNSKLIFSGYPKKGAFPIEVQKGYLISFENLEIYMDSNIVVKEVKRNIILNVENNMFSYDEGISALESFCNFDLIKGDIISEFAK